METKGNGNEFVSKERKYDLIGKIRDFGKRAARFLRKFQGLFWAFEVSIYLVFWLYDCSKIGNKFTLLIPNCLVDNPACRDNVKARKSNIHSDLPGNAVKPQTS